MRLRISALLILLTLSFPARATPLIDDLSIVGDGHTITLSLPSILPSGGLIGASEYETFAQSTATIDGVGGYDLGIVFSAVLNGSTRRPQTGGMEVNVPGSSFDYSFGGVPAIIDGFGGFNPYSLVAGNYTYAQIYPYGTTNSFTVSVTPETTPSPVPEPGTLGLLLTGLLALFLAPVSKALLTRRCSKFATAFG